MDGEPIQGHPSPGNISLACGNSNKDDCPPLRTHCGSESLSDKDMWLFPQAPDHRSPPFDLASLNFLCIPDKTEIEQHHQQLQSMLHALSTCETIPPNTGPSSQR
eukprot:5307255-Ditylum_brightwellii.AAC.1